LSRILSPFRSPPGPRRSHMHGKRDKSSQGSNRLDRLSIICPANRGRSKSLPTRWPGRRAGPPGASPARQRPDLDRPAKPIAIQCSSVRRIRVASNRLRKNVSDAGRRQSPDRAVQRPASPPRRLGADWRALMNRHETLLPVCVAGRMSAQRFRKISGGRLRYSVTTVTKVRQRWRGYAPP
jgi:hypothetical protein